MNCHDWHVEIIHKNHDTRLCHEYFDACKIELDNLEWPGFSTNQDRAFSARLQPATSMRESQWPRYCKTLAGMPVNISKDLLTTSTTTDPQGAECFNRCPRRFSSADKNLETCKPRKQGEHFPRAQLVCCLANRLPPLKESNGAATHFELFCLCDPIFPGSESSVAFFAAHLPSLHRREL